MDATRAKQKIAFAVNLLADRRITKEQNIACTVILMEADALIQEIELQYAAIYYAHAQWSDESHLIAWASLDAILAEHKYEASTDAGILECLRLRGKFAQEEKATNE